MTRNRVEQVIWGAVGLAAGIGLWFVSVTILMLFGFSFYSVIAAVFFELVVWIVAAVLVQQQLRRQRPEVFTYRVAPLLAGMLLTIVFFVVCELIEYPRAILPG